MKVEEISVTKVKQNLLKLPKTKLPEINDFIEFILMKTNTRRSKHVKKLEGIWEGVGFEQISDLDKNIREIRDKSESLMLDRIKKCNT